MMFPYIVNQIGNEKMQLTSIFSASLSQKIELSNEKRTKFVADEVKSYGFNKWLVADIP